MFLVRDTSEAIQKRILTFLNADDCAIAVLLSAAHFEWTVSRAILSLGVKPTARLRKDVGKCHGLGKYKELWQAEVAPGRNIGQLPAVIGDWVTFKKHFELRHLLIHGRESCTVGYATPRVKTILSATARVHAACATEGVDLHTRIKTRRKPRRTHG